MANHSLGLGKGLDALIRESGESRSPSGVQIVAIEDIVPNENQPRRTFDQEALEELANSIRSQGLLQPLLVRPLGPGQGAQYELVAGERRWRACRLAGLTQAPVLIRNFSPQDMLAAALIENLQREDLNPLEEALGLQKLKDSFGLSQDELAQKIGKNRSTIANSLRLLSLPGSARQDLAEGRISAGHARALLSVSDADAQKELNTLIQKHALSVREAEGLAAGWKQNGRFELSGLHFSELAADIAAAQESIQAEAAQESDEPVVAPKAASERGKPQSARLLELQNRIGDLLQVPVRVTGKEHKGKISLSFNSPEELELLLERLSCTALEGAQRKALSAQSAPQLPEQNLAVLQGASKAELKSGIPHSMLEANAHIALAGAHSKALQAQKHTALGAVANDAPEETGPEKEFAAADQAGSQELK